MVEHKKHRPLPLRAGAVVGDIVSSICPRNREATFTDFPSQGLAGIFNICPGSIFSGSVN